MIRSAGKYLVYLLLLLGAVFFFNRFKESFHTTDALSDLHERMADPGDTFAPGPDAGIVAPVEGVEESGIGAAVITNDHPIEVAPAESDGTTDVANVPPVEGQVLTDPAADAEALTASNPAVTPSTSPSAKRSSSTVYLAGFVACLLVLAVCVGWEVTTWFAGRATRTLGAEAEPGDVPVPEFEAAEEEWAKGNHLEAINMLREFLNQNPSEQYAAIRIAEIYEKDLRNYLAAALELEEVLTKKLPEEKWGWTAIHLANIYSGKLSQPEKALATLERIVADHPRTAAARKARQRLGLPEPEQAAPVHPPETPIDAEDPSNLPPGFRSRKR